MPIISLEINVPMQVGIEITCYPLQDGYLDVITNFLDRLHQHAGLEIRVNNMSTRIFGEYDQAMQAVQAEIKRTYDSRSKVTFVLKVLNDPIRDGVLDQ